MEEYKDLEFEVGSYRCFVDFISLDKEERIVDYRLVDLEQLDDPQYEDLDVDQLHDDIIFFCEERGLFND